MGAKVTVTWLAVRRILTEKPLTVTKNSPPSTILVRCLRSIWTLKGCNMDVHMWYVCYVCEEVCVNTCIGVYTCISMLLCTCMHVGAHAWVHVCVCAGLCTCAYSYVLSICVRMCVACVCTCKNYAGWKCIFKVQPSPPHSGHLSNCGIKLVPEGLGFMCSFPLGKPK